MQCGWSLLGPLRWLHYVNKQVKVRTKKGDEHRGWLLSVDPVSASAALLTFSETAASVRVVMGHAVEEVDVLREADEDTAECLRAAILSPLHPSLDPEELRRRKGNVRRWLQDNRVPVEEQGEQLTVAGVLTITAPYRAEDCSSCNQIILDRIQRLIRTQN